MAAITRKMVDRQFELFCKTVPAPEGMRWALDAHSPGDGKTRYRLYTVNAANPHGGVSHGPLCLDAWLGSAAAFDGLHNMRCLADYLNTRSMVLLQKIEDASADVEGAAGLTIYEHTSEELKRLGSPSWEERHNKTEETI